VHCIMLNTLCHMIDVTAAFSTFPSLETERLILRELSFDDVAEIWEMNNDAEILTHMHYGVNYKAYDTLLHLYGLFNTKQAITWGIALRDSNELIGIRSCFIDSSYEPVTIQGQIRREYRNRGYTFEAYEKIINFLETIGVKSIKANADKSNKAAIALLNKLGFQAEHRWPSFSFNDPNPNGILFAKDINGVEEDQSDWIL
jgi:[ribosomal protein S5]-alanine N-acetyltransferase